MNLASYSTLAAGVDFAVNSVISPRYEKLADRERAPGQPAPVFFSIWTPIFIGQMAYGTLKPEEQSKESTLWNFGVSAAGLGYAYTLMSKRYYSMQAMMAAMTYAAYMYRKGLPQSDSVKAKFVKFTAELCLGWLTGADLIVASQNVKRLQSGSISETEADVLGATETGVLTTAAIAANRAQGWNGVGFAGLWALTGIALDQKSKPSVRAMAGVAALGVVADFLNVHAKRETAKDHVRAKPKQIVFEVVETIEI